MLNPHIWAPLSNCGYLATLLQKDYLIPLAFNSYFCNINIYFSLVIWVWESFLINPDKRGVENMQVDQPVASCGGQTSNGAGDPDRGSWVDKLERLTQEIYDIGNPIKFKTPEEISSFRNKVKLKNVVENYLGLPHRPDSSWCNFSLAIHCEALDYLLTVGKIAKNNGDLEQYWIFGFHALKCWKFPR